jgi:hypothetical protein
MEECGPIVYSGNLSTGGLPSFIKIQPTTGQVSIYTKNPSDQGVYTIVLTGTTDFYDTTYSTPTYEITLSILCAPAKLIASMIEDQKIGLGSGKTLIEMEPFTELPKCKGSQVKYESSLASGEQLPAFVTFDSDNMRFTVDTGSVSTVSSYDILVKGTVGDISQAFTWTLDIIESPLLTGALKTSGITLTPIELRV